MKLGVSRLAMLWLMICWRWAANRKVASREGMAPALRISSMNIGRCLAANLGPASQRLGDELEFLPLLELQAERADPDPKRTCCFLPVAVESAQRLHDRIALKLGKGPNQRGRPDRHAIELGFDEPIW